MLESPDFCFFGSCVYLHFCLDLQSFHALLTKQRVKPSNNLFNLELICKPSWSKQLCANMVEQQQPLLTGNDVYIMFFS